MDEPIIEKFLNNTCTVEEAKRVLKWFDTDEGQAYLGKRLDEDTRLLQDKRIKPMLPELKSAKMWRSIQAGMNPAKKYHCSSYSRRNIASYWYAAAIILMAFIFSAFFLWSRIPAEQTLKSRHPDHYFTRADQQLSLTLSDETEIRLNSNSQLWISATYGQKDREVTLKGEAYFKVDYNKDKPFVIHTPGASIKDLGTAFNVRAVPDEDNVQVAVTEGKVSIWPKQKSKNQAIELVHDQFGYLDLKTHSITVDEFGVKNYLSWMNNRFMFNRDPLEKVSEQLSHIYNVSFGYSSQPLKNMTFSADFERGSLRKTLAVISLTLDVDYRIDNRHVVWIKKE